jgi:glycosyltransferase involved in cell wall biosynthesis
MAHIGVNTLSIIPGQIGGGQTYLQNLLSHLSRIDQRNRYTLFVNDYNCRMFPKSESFRQIHCRVSKKNRVKRLFWEQLVLPWRAFLSRIDVLFCPANILPMTPLPCRSVLTIHDLICWHIDMSRADSRLLKWLVGRSARKADRIIAVSEYTMTDIVSKLHVAREKIAVIYEASEGFGRAEGGHGGSSRLVPAATQKYLLAVGTTHHHKNLVRLVEAYALLKSRHQVDRRLIIAGMPGSGHDQLLRRIATLRLEDEVSVRGHVSQEELLELYRFSDLFVFPSLCEGFGLPLLEAMSCGTPIASSNAGSLPEIGGEAAVYFDPLNTEDMAAKMATALTDGDLRKTLVEGGRRRASTFSWEKTARETLNTIEQVCGL